MKKRKFKNHKNFLENEDGSIPEEKLADAWGFGPNDYATTMGMDQDPDWEESYNFDGREEGD